MSKFIIKQFLVSEIAHSLVNNGRLAQELHQYNPDLTQSVFHANHTDMENLVVVEVDAKEAQACRERTQFLLDGLELGDKGQSVKVINEDNDGVVEDTSTYDIVHDVLSIPTDSKIKVRVEAGHCRLIAFYLKWLVVGKGIVGCESDELITCKVAQADDGKEFSRIENVIKNVGVQNVTDQDIYRLTHAMLSDGTIRREVDLRKKTGLKHTRAQKIFGLAVKGSMITSFDKMIRADKIKVGDSHVTLAKLPNGIGSKVKKCAKMSDVLACLEANVKVGDGAKTKAMSGTDIKEELMDRSCPEVQALLIAIVSGQAGDAIEAIIALNAPFMED